MTQGSDSVSCDYTYLPGMALRPIPPAKAEWDPIWRYCRDFLFSDWFEVQDKVASTPQTRLFDDHMWQGDEPMDAVVASFQRIGTSEGRALFEQALRSGVDSLNDPPEELLRLFKEMEQLPEWFDPVKAERGRQRMLAVSLPAQVGTLVFGLFDTVLNTDVSLATGASGRFRYDGANRTAETMFIVSEAYRGAVLPGGEGYRLALRVRLMHAFARHGLRKAWGDEHYREHGNPISNASLCGFWEAASAGVLIDHAMGRTCTANEYDDVWHYFSYWSYLFGVSEPLLPENGMAALRNFDYLMARSGRPAPERAELMNSLITNFTNLYGLEAARGWPFRAGRTFSAYLIAGLGVLIMGPETTRLAFADTAFENIDFARAGRWTRQITKMAAFTSSVIDHVPGSGPIRRRMHAETALLGKLIETAGRALAKKNKLSLDYSAHDNGHTTAQDFLRNRSAAAAR
ncbi:oxygenase MpaB family protein [Mycobacteroides sp. LB1]|uniref:oxygenase MpaB family protein n=1 Tax=Mycobacteroides sp. LB1 TaxID=2750814 RepID=UPI0015DE7B5D|nr:DUF2236 domain-containing protein [Mycobacteroides sp. LB1]